MSDENTLDQNDLSQDDLNTEVADQPIDNEQLSPPEETQQEQPEEPDHVQKVINKKHFEAQQAKRERDELAERLKEFEQKQQEQLQQQFSSIPEMPDPLDVDYEQKLKQRENALLQQAKYNAQQELIRQQEQAQAQLQEQQRQAEIIQSAQTYTERANTLGVDQKSLQESANIVAQYGISDDLTMAILQDQQGPLITQYLAANPVELSNIAAMTPTQAGMYIGSNIRGKLQGLKPKATNAPKPAEDINGPGIGSDDDLTFAKGGSFS